MLGKLRQKPPFIYTPSSPGWPWIEDYQQTGRKKKAIFDHLWREVQQYSSNSSNSNTNSGDEVRIWICQLQQLFVPPFERVEIRESVTHGKGLFAKVFLGWL